MNTMAANNHVDAPTAETETPQADTVVAPRPRTSVPLVAGIASGALAALVLAGGGFVLGFNLGHDVHGGPSVSQGLPPGAGPMERLREEGPREGGLHGTMPGPSSPFGPQQREQGGPNGPQGGDRPQQTGPNSGQDSE